MEKLISEIKYRLFELGFIDEISNSFLHFFIRLLDCYKEVKEKGYYTKKTSSSDYENNIEKFLYNINWNLIEGNTPMSKCLNLIRIFEEEFKDGLCPNCSKENSENTDDLEKSEESKENDGLLQFFKNKTEEEQLKTLEEKQELLSTIKTSELSSHILGKGNLTDKVVNMTESQKKVFNNLSILNTRGKIKSDVKSNDLVHTKISNYNQVTKVGMVDLMMPTFNYKFAKKELIITDKKEYDKQLLILAIDASGSMKREDKVAWVKALIINRLEEVLKGNSNLIICWFEDDLYDNYTIITNKKEAISYLNTMTIFNDGSYTQVDNVIKSIETKIKNNEFKVRGSNPQIVIINDGEDTVSYFTPKYKTHAFILGTDNKGFKNIIENNQGHYERFL